MAASAHDRNEASLRQRFLEEPSVLVEDEATILITPNRPGYALT
jgi:hypothetical protein